MPKDIRIMKAVERDIKFHSRYDATGKVYEYRILNDPYGTALNWNKVYHVKRMLNYSEMKIAAEYFIGTHDFTSFCNIKSVVQDKIRTIEISELRKSGNQIKYIIEGNGFVYNMIRIIVGTLIKIGLGKISSKQIPTILNSKDRNTAGPTAPACALYQKEAIYNNDNIPGLKGIPVKYLV